VLGDELGDGEKLAFRLRRARLSAQSVADLDCGTLPDAVPLRDDGGDAGHPTVYLGPTVDPTLLARIFDDGWIKANLSAPVLDALSRESTEAIVEACITKDGAARARLQTSILYAWDPTDENVDEDVRRLNGGQN
jgi:hypothetical protein